VIAHSVYSRSLYQKGKIQGFPSTVEQFAPTLEEGVVDTVASGVVDVVAVGMVDGVVVEAEEEVTETPGQLLLQKPHLLSTHSPSSST